MSCTYVFSRHRNQIGGCTGERSALHAADQRIGLRRLCRCFPVRVGDEPTTYVKANLDVRYDVSKMRTHLMDCLVRQEVLSFPTVRPRRGGNKPARKVDCITI